MVSGNFHGRRTVDRVDFTDHCPRPPPLAVAFQPQPHHRSAFVPPILRRLFGPPRHQRGVQEERQFLPHGQPASGGAPTVLVGPRDTPNRVSARAGAGYEPVRAPDLRGDLFGVGSAADGVPWPCHGWSSRIVTTSLSRHSRSAGPSRHTVNFLVEDPGLAGWRRAARRRRRPGRRTVTALTRQLLPTRRRTPPPS